MIKSIEAGLLHASCVDFDGNGVLFSGPSGTGKSTTAMACLGLGAKLVSDDQIELSFNGTDVIATRPTTIAGLIEVRGVGILKVGGIKQTNVQLVVDLDKKEERRLPKPRKIELLGQEVPLILGRDIPNLGLVVYHFLDGGLFEGIAQ